MATTYPEPSSYEYQRWADDMAMDEPTPCPECGIGDAEYGLHEANCPSGGDGLDLDELQGLYREFEDEAGHVR